MRLLAFELRMPRSPCEWTGVGRNYVKVLSVKNKCLANPGWYEYDFGDGWRAAVIVTEVDGKTARKLRKESDGFAGYEWMIDEIRYLGRIRTLSEKQASKDDGREG